MDTPISSFEDTLAYMQLCYPTLFPNRYYAMNQLFFVLGNGYEWEIGSLADGRIPPKHLWRRDAMRIRTDHWRFCCRLETDSNKRLVRDRKTSKYPGVYSKMMKRDLRVNNARDFKKHMRQELREARDRQTSIPNWYQLCPPSDNFPDGLGDMYEIVWDEIRDDWLVGLIEALELVLNDRRTLADFQAYYDTNDSYTGRTPVKNARYYHRNQIKKRAKLTDALRDFFGDRHTEDAQRAYDHLLFNQAAVAPILAQAKATQASRCKELTHV